MEITKKTVTLGIIITLILILSIIQIIFSFILLVKISKDFKKRQVKDVDINISGLKSFNFTDFPSRPIYSASDANLGLAGKLYLDCYSGLCYKIYIETREVCDIDDDCETYEVKHDDSAIVKACSEQCFETKEKLCYNECSDFYDSKNGYCSRNTNDKYDVNKVCLGDNIIYFWKGKRYNVEDFQFKKYNYINDARLKEEPCPENTKNCGILDDNENKLCLPIDSDCPINYISETKLNENYNYDSITIDGKTFYYTYDNSSNKKIIAGLYADSDLFLNTDEEDYITLDTYTISQFLKENYVLYRGLNLGYDPYNISNIDEKGKSYLKIKYNQKNLDLVSLRKEYQEYTINKLMNKSVIDSVRKRYKTFIIMGLIAYIIFALLLALGFYFLFNGDRYIIVTIIIMSIIFLIFSIFGLIKGCININNFNEAKDIDILKNYDSTRTINLLYVIFGFTIYGLLIAIGVAEGLFKYCKNYSFRTIDTYIEKQKQNDISNQNNNNSQINQNSTTNIQ